MNNLNVAHQVVNGEEYCHENGLSFSPFSLLILPFLGFRYHAGFTQSTITRLVFDKNRLDSSFVEEREEIFQLEFCLPITCCLVLVLKYNIWALKSRILQTFTLF